MSCELGIDAKILLSQDTFGCDYILTLNFSFDYLESKGRMFVISSYSTIIKCSMVYLTYPMQYHAWLENNFGIKRDGYSKNFLLWAKVT